MFFFKSVIVAVAAIASVAKGLEITYPKSTDTLKAGQRFRLELDYRPGQGQHIKDLSVAVGIQSCALATRWNTKGSCDGFGSTLGPNLIFAGPFAPETVPGSGSLTLVQDFWLTVPTNLSPGLAVIDVIHFALSEDAAGFSQFVETTNVTVTIGK